MSIFFRQITDIVSITALLTIGLYHLCSFVVRSRQETDNSDFYFALFVISLAGYIFFSNTLSLLLYKEELARRLNTTGATFCIFIMTVGFYNCLYAILKIPRPLHLVKNASTLISFLVFIACLFIWKYGYSWYRKTLDTWIVLAIGMIFLTNSVLLIWAGAKNGQLKSASRILFFLASHVLIISLFIFKVLLIIDARNFLINNFIILLFSVLFFPVLLVSKSSRELQELTLLKVKLRNPDTAIGLNMQKMDEFISGRKMTDMEKKVLSELLKGLEYKEVANNLDLSLSAVKKRVHSIYKKASVQNRVELVNQALGLKF
ncbi:MAG: helix-turn-helix transcriptional regulator [Spirochaetales bacterium]|nr:helix-turn-helix transcriptional regulator [Spirochaetales bacterium]